MAESVIGWQDDGSYIPCPDCRWEPEPDSDAPGVAIHVLPRTPGSATHRGDCPRVEFLDRKGREELLDRLAEMDRVRRRGAAEARNFVIG